MKKIKLKWPIIASIGLVMIGIGMAVAYYVITKPSQLPVKLTTKVEDISSLTEVGEWTTIRFYDDEFKVSLQRVNNPEKLAVVNLENEVEFNVQEVQLLKFEDVTDRFIRLDWVAAKYIKNHSFYALRVVYGIKNLIDKDISFDGIKTIETNTGEKIDVQNVYYETNEYFELDANSAIKKDSVIVPISYKDAQNVVTVKIETSSYLVMWEPVKERQGKLSVKIY